MSERQSPQSEVRGSVRNSSKDELNGLNHLMDEKATKGVVMLFLDASLAVKDSLVHLDVIFVLVEVSNLITSVNESLIIFSTRLSRSDVIKFSFIVVCTSRLTAESIGARLNAEHEWDTDGYHKHKEKRKRLLSREEVDSIETILVAKFHEVVDHDRDDSRVLMKLGPPLVLSTVGVEGVAPLVDHEEVHPAE